MALPIENRKTAKRTQQELAECFGSSGIVWDLYTEDQQIPLQKKLEMFYPDPVIPNEVIESILETEESCEEKDDKIQNIYKDFEKQKKRVTGCRKAIFDALWNQRKYNNNNLLASTIFILVTDYKDSLNENDILNATEFQCYSLFRIRKCRKTDIDAKNCCMIFVDEQARVYTNWEDYLSSNLLPEGLMIVPAEGFYQFNISDKSVKLEVHKTPALQKKILKYVDTGAGIAGIAATAAGLGGALISLPVTGPLLAGAAVVGGASALWSTFRSASMLASRSTHEQAIDLSDREARGHWLGVTGGVVGLGAMGATATIAQIAAKGKDVPQIFQLAVNGLNISALLANGAGVGNGLVELILKKEDGVELTSIDIIQFGASLFLFTHSVYNFQTASKIVESTRNATISQFRKELSNRQRKMFDKMAKETVRIKGNEQGKIDIIRGLKNIPDNKYFNDVYKINKELNKNNVKPSIGPDGSVLLNNEISVDSKSLRNNVQYGIGELYLNRAGDIPATHVDGKPNKFIMNTFRSSADRLLQKVVVNITSSCTISNVIDVQNLILNILIDFCESVLETLIEIAQTFINYFLEDIKRTVSRYIDFEEVLSCTYDISLKLTGGNSKLMKQVFLRSQTPKIIARLKTYFLKSNPNSTVGCQPCKNCNGFYYIAKV